MDKIEIVQLPTSTQDMIDLFSGGFEETYTSWSSQFSLSPKRLLFNSYTGVKYIKHKIFAGDETKETEITMENDFFQLPFISLEVVPQCNSKTTIVIDSPATSAIIRGPGSGMNNRLCIKIGETVQESHLELQADEIYDVALCNGNIIFIFTHTAEQLNCSAVMEKMWNKANVCPIVRKKLIMWVLLRENKKRNDIPFPKQFYHLMHQLNVTKYSTAQSCITDLVLGPILEPNAYYE